MDSQTPSGLPARAAIDASGLHLGLLSIGPGELRDPFLADTVKRVAATQTVVHVPRGELGREADWAAPVGVIFHVARCGSTLASQMLRARGDVAVYSEPLAINELLVPPHAAERPELVAALRTLGRFFALHAGRPYVLKLSSWNVLFCEIVAEAFPDSPWALCLRDPLEVSVSLLERPPSWLRPEVAARFSPLLGTDLAKLNPEERAARLFAAFCRSASRLDRARGLRLAYEALPAATWQELAPHFGLQTPVPMLQRMMDASEADSKSPPDRPAPFRPDQLRKRAAASPALRQAVEELARPAYDRLSSDWPERLPFAG